MAAAQMSHLLVAYAQEYLEESQSARYADCDPTRADGNTQTASSASPEDN
jgi:hypothetical protein